ncbi:hypothetical protein OSTOST_07433 [Ostertagia ostertagi]
MHPSDRFKSCGHRRCAGRSGMDFGFLGTPNESRISQELSSTDDTQLLDSNAFLIRRMKPFSFHATNVLLHAAASCLFLFFIQRLQFFSTSPESALFATLLFTVHPVHCEAVAGVVGRADVLAAIAVLSGILLYEKTQSTLAAALCTAIAICFKETGIMLPPLLVVFLLLKPTKVTFLQCGDPSLQVSPLLVIPRLWRFVLSTARCPCPCDDQGVTLNARWQQNAICASSLSSNVGTVLRTSSILMSFSFFKRFVKRTSHVMGTMAAKS